MTGFGKTGLFKVEFAFKRSWVAIRAQLRPGRNSLAPVIAAALLMTACGRQTGPSPAIVIEHEIAPNPVRVGAASITLRLADNAAKPVTGAQVSLEADMSHAGMAPVFADAKETVPGSYESHLLFGMAGDWIVLVHVVMPGGKKVDRQFNVRGVRPD